MSKDAYYFPHDSNARHDPKIIAMTSVYGMEGYAWYWVIVEMLREQESYRYSFKSKYAINSMAKEMNALAKGCLALWLEQSSTSKWLIISLATISWVMIYLLLNLSILSLIPLVLLLTLSFYLGYIIRTYSI